MKSYLILAGAALAMPVAAQRPASSSSVAPPDMQWVAPGLADYTDEVLFGDVWRRSDLSLRYRSLVTVAALVASGNAHPRRRRRGPLGLPRVPGRAVSQ